MEFLFELFIDGLVDVSGNPKIPIVIRLFIFTIILFIPIAISILAGVAGKEATGIAGAIICWVIAAACIFLWVFGCYKIVQNKKSKS